MNNYFIFNESSCVGCEACVVGCVLENGVQIPQRWRSIFKSNGDKIPGVPLFNLSMACNHCADAPCLKGCPTSAYTMDTSTGAILIDGEKCIGCKYCTWNCPYNAPKYSPETQIIDKCNFCNDRILDNAPPACAVACPTGALDFSFEEIDNDQTSDSIDVPVDPNPSIIIKKDNNRNEQVIDKDLYSELDIVPRKRVPKISAIAELPLLIFTFIVSCMVAFSASGIVSEQNIVAKISFIAIGGMGALISILHLGKKTRFWRSILNFKTSWLSREILFFSVYLFLITINLLVFSIPNAIIVFFGILTLLSIDMVYKPLQWKWKTQWHSGQVLLISATFFLLLNQFYIFLIVLLLIRLGLTILMYSKERFDIMPVIWVIFMIKTVIMIYGEFEIWLVLLVYIFGEFAARIVFYDDLEIYNLDESIKKTTELE